jgi:hypothetical protein
MRHPQLRPRSGSGSARRREQSACAYTIFIIYFRPLGNVKHCIVCYFIEPKTRVAPASPQRREEIGVCMLLCRKGSGACFSTVS